MTDPQLFDLVYKMRQAQKAYFKNRLNRDLQDSKALEKQVDVELAKRLVSAAITMREETGKLF